MARKPNYDFERREREKARARKKAERARAKQEKSNQSSKDVGEDPLAESASTVAKPPETENKE